MNLPGTMHGLLAIILTVGIASAAVAREKRQVAGCQEPKLDNLCTDNILTVPLHFPHPLDNRKFLQCANGRRMFIITCPEGEVYSQATTSCGTAQVVNPVVMTTAAPSNPCTPDNIATGNIFFPYVNDVTKFIECSPDGTANVLSCPPRLQYDASRQSCVLKTTLSPTTTTTTTTTTTQPPTPAPTQPPMMTAVPPVTAGSGNPCTPFAIMNNQLFFPHPDPFHFYQCDLAGNVYIMQCPSNLVWNQKIGQCDTMFHVNNGLLIG